MTKKDYKAIAKAINNHRTGELNDEDEVKVGIYRATMFVDTFIEDLCNIFLKDNPRFDKARFVAACDS